MTRAAEAVRAVRGDAGTFTETCTADAGHDELGGVISQLLSRVASGWSEQTAELNEVADRLKTTADLYQRADEDSAPRSEGLGQ
jgi:hypothetical protein